MSACWLLRAAKGLSDFCRCQELEQLDGTRIHPENYHRAVKMAKDALELDDDADDEDDTIRQIMKPDLSGKLDELDLDAYANVLLSEVSPKRRFGPFQIRLF